jgi:hypothetical protein
MNAYPQPTIWEVPDEVWTLSAQVLHEVDPAKPQGQRRVHRRRMLKGMLCRRRTGCPWNHLPQAIRHACQALPGVALAGVCTTLAPSQGTTHRCLR